MVTVNPRRRRGSNADESPPLTGAIEDAVIRDNDLDAESVAELLDGLRSASTEESKVIVFKLPLKGGQWEYLKTLTPPINFDGILEDLMAEFGGGKYSLRIFANGRVVKSKTASIAGSPKMPGTNTDTHNSGLEILPMLMNTQQKASSDMVTMMTMMMQQSQQASDRQMQMMQNSSAQTMQMMMALIPAMMGGKDTPASMIAALAPFLNKEDKGNGMGDTLALLQIAKSLVSPESAGGDGDESMFQTLIKTLGPGFMDAVAKMQAQQPPPVAAPQLPAPPVMMAPPLFRPNPVMPPPMPFQAPPQATASQTAGGSAAVLALVGEDVVFFARRGHDPALAAEAVLERIDKAGIPDSDLMALVFQFQSSTDWLADLARDGYDIRGHAEWADAFISELVGQYSDNSGAGEPVAREGGGGPDTQQDGGDS